MSVFWTATVVISLYGNSLGTCMMWGPSGVMETKVEHEGYTPESRGLALFHFYVPREIPPNYVRFRCEPVVVP